MTDTLYDILNISETAPPAVVRAAYQAMSTMHHPDKNSGDPAATELMKKVNNAYRILRDPDLRAQYDETLRRARLLDVEVEAEPAQAEGFQTEAAEKSDFVHLNTKVRIDWVFWVWCIALGMLVKLIGPLAVLIGVALFYWVRKHKSTAIATLVSCLAVVAVVVAVGVYASNQSTEVQLPSVATTPAPLPAVTAEPAAFIPAQPESHDLPTPAYAPPATPIQPSKEEVEEARKRDQYAAKASAELKERAARAVADFPYLETPEGAETLQKILDYRDEQIRGGTYPALALTRAVNKYAPGNDPRGQR